MLKYIGEKFQSQEKKKVLDCLNEFTEKKANYKEQIEFVKQQYEKHKKVYF
jgi:hypothetical protein